MKAQDRSDRRETWTSFLLAAVASITIWDVLYFFAFHDWALTQEAGVPLLLLALPFVVVSLLACFLVWQRQKGIAARGLSIFIAILLPIGIAMLIGRIHEMIYPLRFYGIP